ncbi:MAG: hypothetical protein KJ048_05620 [Dehalococcoidia bacterium]|nr:hypothetical protein [Dehalococcoidia bacterium]
MDNDFNVDLEEIASTIRTHEVVIVRFITVGQRLLLDFRASEIDGPVVRLVEPVRNVQERYKSLRQLRPRFGDPEKIVAVFWPRFARSLEETGVWRQIAERIIETGHAESVREAADVMAELMDLERGQQRAAIRGDELFKTLWSASPTRR